MPIGIKIKGDLFKELKAAIPSAKLKKTKELVQALKNATPVDTGKARDGWIIDKDGNIVVTKLNQEMIQQIAEQGNGKYVFASNYAIGLNAIFDDI